MVSTRRNLNNQTASAEPEIVNSGRIAKKRRSNGPQKRLSTHIKNIIVDKCLRKESMKKAEVARMFGVSWQTVDNIVEKYVRDGTVEPKKQRGCRQKNIRIHQEHSQFIQDILDEGCTVTVGFMRGKLFEQFPQLQEQGLDPSTLYKHIVKHIGFTLKRTKPVEEKRNDPTTIARRKAYVDNMPIDGVSYKTNCIFLDEAGFNATLLEVKDGENSVVKTKTKRALNVIIRAAISYQGVESIQAKVAPGGKTGQIFSQFVKGVMEALDMNNSAPHYFVMDDASIHRSAPARELFSSSRHKLHLLPPYSPFLNPVEECFSTLKTLVKRKPGLARDAFLKHISESSHQIASENCQGWIEHSIHFFLGCSQSKEIL
ncbi:hypothetical protein G6F42_019259 [Rhizopus arrhizus]|nr:hypothetical protein G6F42_019259 [Rhizopus arrhizus]